MSLSIRAIRTSILGLILGLSGGLAFADATTTTVLVERVAPDASVSDATPTTTSPASPTSTTASDGAPSRPSSVAAAAPTAATTSTGVDWSFLLLVAIAALSGLSNVLHLVAPRTRNTIDDTVRDQLDEVLVVLRGGAAAVAKPAATRDAQAGFAKLGMMLALATGGALLAASTGCATARAVPDAAKTAVVDCSRAQSQAIAAVVAQLGTLATLSVIGGGEVDWQDLEKTAIAEGKIVGGCALATFVAELNKSGSGSGERSKASPLAVRTDATTPDVAKEGAAALERFRTSVGGVRWSVAGRVL